MSDGQCCDSGQSNIRNDWATLFFQDDCGCTHPSSETGAKLLLFDLQDQKMNNGQKRRRQVETAQKTVGLVKRDFCRHRSGESQELAFSSASKKFHVQRDESQVGSIPRKFSFLIDCFFKKKPAQDTGSPSNIID